MFGMERASLAILCGYMAARQKFLAIERNEFLMHRYLYVLKSGMQKSGAHKCEPL